MAREITTGITGQPINRYEVSVISGNRMLLVATNEGLILPTNGLNKDDDLKKEVE